MKSLIENYLQHREEAPSKVGLGLEYTVLIKREASDRVSKSDARALFKRFEAENVS
jgi:hypothetical protein